MERAYGSSKKLYDALEGVEREWSTNQPTQILQYMEMLREKMACPDLSSVLDGSMPAEVGVKTSVRDAARLMREYRTTAVLVMEHHSIAGIFTSKDIVLRVIAAGLDPSTCSVVRVMTPHPDTAPPQTSILDALKKMYGKYQSISFFLHERGLFSCFKTGLHFAKTQQHYLSSCRRILNSD